MSAPDVQPELREALAEALFRAHRFVETHGDEAARLRGAALLRVSPEAVAAREAAIAARSADAEDPRAMLAILAGFAEIRALRARAAAALASRVASAQRADGSWRAPGHEADPDPALPPFTTGDTDALYLTGVLGALLARSAAVGDRTLAAAAAFLASRFKPDLLEGAPWHGLAAYTALFSNVDHERDDEILQWCGRELEKGFRAGRIAPLAAARVLLVADARALPGARLLPSEILAALVAAQSGDGGFGAGSDAARVATTLDALAALLHLAGIRPGALASA